MDAQDNFELDDQEEITPKPKPRRKSGGTTRRSGASAPTPASSYESEEGAPEPNNQAAWYVIHCYSGYENKVRYNLEQ
ncbi:MAG TPA: hypothetical protein PKN11_03845, partial [Anaerolineaceae bacterium]|nr:hypothetical protein [Anaerolineaceae bacterium]